MVLNKGLYGLAGIGIWFSLLKLTDNLNPTSLFVSVAVIIFVVIILVIYDEKLFENALSEMSGPKKSKLQKAAMTYDETFDFVNEEFLANDKRDREIEDVPGNTRSQQLSISSSDGDDFVFRAIKAPFAEESESLFVIVECLTQRIIDYDTLGKKSQVKGDMFKSSPQVERLRKRNRGNKFSTDDLRQMVGGMGFNPRNGMYGNPYGQQNKNMEKDTGDKEEEEGDDE